jgi:hypothetical protein
MGADEVDGSCRPILGTNRRADARDRLVHGRVADRPLEGRR